MVVQHDGMGVSGPADCIGIEMGSSESEIENQHHQNMRNPTPFIFGSQIKGSLPESPPSRRSSTARERERERERESQKREMSPPPNYEFQEWWSKQQSTSTSSSSDDPDRPAPTWATVDIGSPPAASPAAATTDKSSRSRNARQLRNLVRLRLHSSLSALSHILSASLSLAASASRRLASARPDRWSDTTRLYRATKAIAFLALLLLAVESLAFYNGWHLRPPSSEDFSGLLQLAYAAWLSLRADYIAPPLQALADVCIVLFLIQTVDRLVLVP